MLLKSGLALGEPAGDLQDRPWILADQGQHRVDQSVGFDQGSVEIDAKGNLGVESFREEVSFGYLVSVLRRGGRAFGLQGGAPDVQGMQSRSSIGSIQ